MIHIKPMVRFELKAPSFVEDEQYEDFIDRICGPLPVYDPMAMARHSAWVAGAGLTSSRARWWAPYRL